MSKLIYVTGGARSGKSGFAERIISAKLADMGADANALYIATARAFDDEMRARIAHHRESRPASWVTYEDCYDIAARIAAHHGPILIDCMTILVTNRMLDSELDWDTAPLAEADGIEAVLTRELDGWRAALNDDSILVIVSNELGMGLVPVYRFSRIFRDMAGRLNQKLANIADEAYFMVSGQSLRLK